MRAASLIGLIFVILTAAGFVILNPAFALEYYLDFNELEEGYVFTPEEQPYSDLGGGHGILIGGEGIPTIFSPEEGTDTPPRAVRNAPFPGSLEGSSCQDLEIDLEGFRSDRASVFLAFDASGVEVVDICLIAYQEEISPEGERRWLKVDSDRVTASMSGYIITELAVAAPLGEGVIDRLVVTRGDDPVGEMIDSLTVNVWEGIDPGSPRDEVQPDIRIAQPLSGATVRDGTIIGQVEEDICLVSLTARWADRSMPIPFEAIKILRDGLIRYDFNARLLLDPGENTITLIAEDAAGRWDEKSFEVIYILPDVRLDSAEPRDFGLDLEGSAADRLLIITPYLPYSEEMIQWNREWVDFAYTLAEYKRNTGMPTEVMTLEKIEKEYRDQGRDLAEQVKRAIYDKVRQEGIRYVMLVGDGELFPVRYCMKGYMDDGSLLYYDDPEEADYESVVNIYQFFPSDFYYANLWHDNDPSREFDSWDADEDNFFGEFYCNNYRGVDLMSIDPDVAVGRVPCDTPDEFYGYINKVVEYEQRIERSGGHNRTLLMADFEDKYHRSIRRIAEDLEGSWEVSSLFRDTREEWHLEEGGEDYSIDDPADFVKNHIEDNLPRFVCYIGHGSPNSWQGPSFRRDQALGLENYLHPSIIVATESCSTAKFVESIRSTTLFEEPVVSTADVESMAEAFLTKNRNGGVIYLGCVIASRPFSEYQESRAFFEAVSGGMDIAGEAWIDGLERYKLHHADLYRRDRSEWTEVTDGNPNYPRKWRFLQAGNFHMIFRSHFMGDPSLRLNGSEEPGDWSAPLTRVEADEWINRDEAELGAIHSHEIRFKVDDDSRFEIKTKYRYQGNNYWNLTPGSTWYGWYETSGGETCNIPMQIIPSMDGNHATVNYHSTDIFGNEEPIREFLIGYDFTAPTCSLAIDGVSIAGVPCSEEDGPCLLPVIELDDDSSIIIRGEDEYSEVRGIQYAFGLSSEWGRVHPGPLLEIGPPLFGGSVIIRYRAVDNAGNKGRALAVRINSPATSITQIEILINGPPPDPDDFSPVNPPQLDTPINLPFPPEATYSYFNPQFDPNQPAIDFYSPDAGKYYGLWEQYESITPVTASYYLDPLMSYENDEAISAYFPNETKIKDEFFFSEKQAGLNEAKMISFEEKPPY